MALKKLSLEKEKEKKLEDIANVVAQINKRTTKDELLRMIHTLLLGRVNKKVLVKSNLKSFSGLVYDDDHTREKFEQKLERHKVRDLRDIARFFGQDNKGEKEELVKTLADYLEKPGPSDRSYSSEKKKLLKKDLLLLPKNLLLVKNLLLKNLQKEKDQVKKRKEEKKIPMHLKKLFLLTCFSVKIIVKKLKANLKKVLLLLKLLKN